MDELMAKTTSLQKARQGKWALWVFVILPISFFGLFVIWPTIHLIYLSLQTWKGMGPMKYVGLKNYLEIFTDDKFWMAVQHNAFWAVATVCGTTIAGLFLALLLGRTKARGRWAFQILLFLPQMVSSVVVSIIWRWIYFPQNGPLNVLLGYLGLSGLQRSWLGESQTALPALFIAYSWIAYGFSMLVFLAAIDSVDQELFDAARIDGANWFGEIWYILLPVIRPAARTVFIMMGIWSFQVFDMVWLTTRGGPGYSTIVLALEIYKNTFVESRVGVGSALATILLLLVLILAIITRRGGSDELEASI
jgi:ABC-type sugar transport system permease subunit